MTFGVTTDGFVKKSLPDVLAAFEARQRDEISASLDFSSSSPLGQINAIIGAEVAELWDLGEAIYVAWDPDKNTGAGQDAVAAITGTTREPAVESYVDCTVSLDAGTTLTAGSLISVEGNPSIIFEMIGPLVGFPAVVVPGDYTAPADGTYQVRFQCTETGPKFAPAGTMTVIVTPITGWNSVTNATDTVKGQDVETASKLRLRREDELFAAGSSPLDAIKAELLALAGMVSVKVFENVDLITDANGLPGKSIECLCFDGPSPAVADEDIAQTIWDAKAGGIQTYGLSSADATDDDGEVHTMFFSRPVAKPVYFTVDIVVNPDTFPTTGDADIEAALVTFGTDNQTVGLEVALSLYYASVTGIAGVKKISAFKAGFSASPVGTADLSVATRELATFDTSRIVINHV